MKTTFSNYLKAWTAGPTAPEAGSEDYFTLTLTYRGAASSERTLARLPYGKALAICLIGDDNLENHRQLCERLQRDATLALSDGTGGVARNTMTLAVNAFTNYNNNELGTAGAGGILPLGALAALRAAGHDLATHGKYHALDGNFHAASAAANLSENKAYYWNKLGAVFNTVVAPNGDTAYVSAAEKGHYFACLTEGSAPHYTLFPQEYGPVPPGGPAANRPAPIELLPSGFVHLKRWFNDLDSADDVPFLKELFDKAWADHSPTAHPFLPFGMHGCDPAVVATALKYMRQVAKDSLLITGLPTLLNYHRLREEVTVARDVTAGRTRTLKLDLRQGPASSAEDLLTLFVGPGLQAVSVAEAGAVVRFNPVTGQVNVSRKRVFTSAEGRPR